MKYSDNLANDLWLWALFSPILVVPLVYGFVRGSKLYRISLAIALSLVLSAVLCIGGAYVMGKAMAASDF